MVDRFFVRRGVQAARRLTAGEPVVRPQYSLWPPRVPIRCRVSWATSTHFCAILDVGFELIFFAEIHH